MANQLIIIQLTNQSINYFKNKVDNPAFFLWSNNFKNIDPSLFDEKITLVQHNEKFYSKGEYFSAD